ncbi:MAG: HAMP domain-containing histidine kinase [Muribaculaceae bacterium]|nr:HAMP domain-containing histidine kinase [Muribaculaceae bacterium]
MKHLKEVMRIGLIIAAVAVMAAAYNLMRLYEYEKAKTLDLVRTCAENADILEITSRMESNEKASQAFVRLNAFMEMAQQKDGRISSTERSDTIQTSLASLLRFGLEFSEGKSNTDFRMLDSIFMAELNRHGLFPSIAAMLPFDSLPATQASKWKTELRTTPNARSIKYEVYVSPLPGKVLSRMWGIIIPFTLIIAVFSFLSFYLLRIIKRLRTLDRMKDDFTHNMTHELKTPVAVAYSAADSMLRYYDQSDETRNRRFLNIILQRLSHLSGMIENILSMSMERFNSLRLNLESVKLKDLVEEIAGMIELKADKPVEIGIDIPDELTVYADSLHLGNMISNLLDNAVKYSKESVLIRISANADTLAIADNGIGISKEDLPYIFDKFFRVASGDRYEVGGYGLGLYYVRQIVTLHGWSITAESNPGNGTVFIIKLKDNEKG